MQLKTLGRTLLCLGSFWLGERKVVAWSWLALIVVMLVVINVLNIGISYAERSVMTSLQEKEVAAFWLSILMYAGIFIAATPIIGNFGWVKNKMHRTWRDYLTRSLLAKYFDNDRFLDINTDSRVTNPEQRLQQDADKVLDKLMTFVLCIVDSGMSLISFSVILWLISPQLLIFAVVYAAVGTFIMVKWGMRLIGLHFHQETLEADLRREILIARENAVPIASYRGAARELQKVYERLRLTLANCNSLISWNRNLTLFKVGYDYLILVVPLAMTAPLFFSGDLDMGGVTQAGAAFGRVLGALSIIVHQFMLIAELSAGSQRLVSFEDVLNEHHADRGDNGIRTEIGEGLTAENLSVKTPDGKATIISNISFSLNPGQMLLLRGPSGIGKSTVLKALAGLRKTGSGRVTRPDPEEVMYLPQSPYMPEGTLREQLLYPYRVPAPSDEELIELLKKLDLECVVQREGGLDAVQDWYEAMSGGQHQRIAIARVLITNPKLIILDEATSGLDDENEELVYEIIRATGITTVSVAHRRGVVKHHDSVLVMRKDGTSKVVDARTYKPSTSRTRKK